MSSRNAVSSRSWGLTVASLAVAGALMAAGCGADDGEGDGGSGGSRAAERAVAFAEDRLGQLDEGTQRKPPVSGPAAQVGKKVWVISCGESVESCSFSSAAAMAAGKAIGWEMTLFDGKLNPSTFQAGIRQAVAARPDGIILYAIDCGDTRGALKEARQAGIEVVAFDAFDCDDPSVGGEALFSAENGQDYDDYAEAIVAWGHDKAAWLVAQTGGRAKVIEVRQIGALVTDYIHEGFMEGIARCKPCEVVGTVELTFEDVAMGTVAEKVSSALLQHPDANAVHVPIDSLVVLGAGTAIAESGRSEELAVMGGEGFAANLDLIRSGGPQDAAVAFQQEWIAWATVDTLNRVFAGETEIPDQGFGWQLVDEDHNLPPEGGYRSPVDFKRAYRAIWGG